jgi:HEAT repeat protein
MTVLKSAGRNWNDPAGELIKIGDPAVPALVDLLFDKSESRWNRRVAAMTLNQIHSPHTVEPGLKLLYDTSQEWELRNHIIPSIRGFNIPDERDRLWELFTDPDAERYKGNIASLLVFADTSMAYLAYLELFHETDSYMKMQSMRSLASLRPAESTFWYLQGIQSDDWWTANVAMDSIISLDNPDTEKLEEIYHSTDKEKVRWRITYIFNKLAIPESLPFLEKAIKDSSWLIKMEAREAFWRRKALGRI